MPAAIGLGTSIVGGIMGGSAAKNAAAAQQAGAEKAASTIGAAGAASSATNDKTWAQTQATNQPYLNAGSNAINTINSGLQQGGQFSTTPQFVAPTAVTEQNDPGYQFRLQQGQQALERSAAARGNVLGAGTSKALARYGQDYGSNEYSKVYDRSMQGYQANLNSQNTLFNRYAGVAQNGQQMATTQGQEGQNYTNANSNILMSTANGQAQQYNNAAAARASGYVGQSNAYSNMLSGINDASNLKWSWKNKEDN